MTNVSDDDGVGYGRPPKKHQFKAGQPSANPNGRRGKKGKVTELGATELPKTPKDLMAEAAMQEMLRPVPVKVGGKTEMIPSYQVLVRKIVQEALTAPTSAASRRVLFDIAHGAVDHHLSRKQEWVDKLKTYKTEWDEKLRENHKQRREARQRGETSDYGSLHPVPHPENIVVDPWTYEFRIDGPVNDQQLAMEGQLLGLRAETEYTMFLAARAYREATSDEERQLHRDAIKKARKTWMLYNSKVSRTNKVAVRRLDEFDVDMEPPEQDEF